MPDFSIPISLLKKPIDEVYALSTNALKTKLGAMRAAGRIEALHKKLWHIQKVKTIWNPDRPMSLSSIFHPVHVQHIVDGQSVSRQVDSLADLHYSRCLLLGTAGQGKSILMKYLVGKEIRSGERVPLLLELRTIEGMGLEENLSELFSSLIGIARDDSIFNLFSERGKFSFLLDGFDEVDPLHVHAVLQDIEKISFKYPLVKIVLTSRPDSDCGSLTQFSAVRLCPLPENKLFEFFKKITKDNVFSERLTKAIGRSSAGIKDLITTPLAATLLAIVYRAGGRIPDEFSEFYEELFQVLVQRHDASKLGWRRQRSSGLTDRQLQFAFEAFCFQVRRRRSLSASLDDAVRMAQEGLDAADLKADASACLNDLKKVTCLIVQEGRSIDFVHASVANFFASKFVKALSEDQAKTFYGQLVTGHWGSWLAEINFLRQIDSQRITAHFLVPDLERSITSLSFPLTTEMVVDGFLSNTFLVKTDMPGSDSPKFYVQSPPPAFSYGLRDFMQIVYNGLFISKVAGSVPWLQAAINTEKDGKVSWKSVALARGPQIIPLIVSEVEKRHQILIKELSDSRALLGRAEMAAPLLTL